MTTYHLQASCLDLEQIARSGQCFRMTPTGDGVWQIISRGKRLLASGQGESLQFICDEADLPYWKHYFDLERDYQAILRSICPQDAYLTAAAAAGAGIRILNQDPWEMIITFVISQQKTIPAIAALTEALCRRWGSRIETDASEPLYAFPTPDQLSQASLEELLNLKLGYRAKYIYRLSREAAQGILDLNLLSSLSYSEAMDYLTGFYGIGKKVANCICLFGLHHIDAFPVDTWIQKILEEHYFDPEKDKTIAKSRLYDQIIRRSFGSYDGYKGIIQQYIFFYERSVLSGKKGADAT